MKKIAFVLSAMSVFMFANNAFAVDTNELLDKGVVEVAPTIGLVNIHDGKPGWRSNLGVNYGVLDFMTISSTFAMESALAFTGFGFGFDFDVLFTPVDTEHFDIDFHVDFGFDDHYFLAPGLEFNIDSNNDMSGFGAFLRLDFPIYSGVHYTPANPNDPAPEGEKHIKTDFEFDWALGLYFSFMEGHQLLLEGGMGIANAAKKLPPREIGGYVALGYNVEVMENFEIVSELKINIPEKGDGTNADITVGAIIDIPTL